MNRFQFRLARVMEYRQRQLEAADEALRRLLAELQAEVGRKELLHRQYLAEESAVIQARTVQPAEMAALAAYRRHVRAEQARIDHRIAECTVRVGKQRAELMEARRRYRLLERLHEKRKAEWDAAFVRETDALAEESFLARWRPTGSPGDDGGSPVPSRA